MDKMYIRVDRALRLRATKEATAKFFAMLGAYDRDIQSILDTTGDYRIAVERLNTFGAELGYRFKFSEYTEQRLNDILENNLMERFRNRSKQELNKLYGKENAYVDTDSFWKLHSIIPFSDNVSPVDR